MRFEVVLEIDIWQFFVKHGFSTMSQKLEIRGLPVAISGHDGYYDYRFLQKVFMFVYVVGAWHPTLSSYDSRSVWKSKLVCFRKQYFLVRPRDLKLAGSLLRFEITLDIAIRIFPPQKKMCFLVCLRDLKLDRSLIQVEVVLEIESSHSFGNICLVTFWRLESQR